MENEDPHGNPIWLLGVYTISLVIAVISFIIIAVMLANLVHPGPVLTWTFWVSLAVYTISCVFVNFGSGGRGPLC